MLGRTQELLLVVLAANIRRALHDGSQLLQGHHVPVHRSPGTPFGRNRTTYHALIIRVRIPFFAGTRQSQEASFHHQPFGTFPHGIRIGARAQQQPNSRKKRRLASTGFTRDHRQTRSQGKKRLFDEG